MSLILAPSLLAADAAHFGEAAAAARRGGAAMLHLDIMDGHFVPNLSFGPHVAACLNKTVNLPLDVHLMVEQPSRFVEPFCDAGAASVNLHVETESTPALLSLLRGVHERGLRTAVTLKPGTALERLEPFLEHVDMVLIMTVEPGYGGQAMLPGSLGRIAAARALLDAHGGRILLQIDGGVTLENAADCRRAGADILVAGSSVFGAPDIEERVRQFLALEG